MNLGSFAQQIGIRKKSYVEVKDWCWPLRDRSTYEYIINDWHNGILPIFLKNEHYKDGTVIQAGGNCGVYPFLFTQFFKRVYTFEPDPINFFCLVNNCQMNEISKFNCALGDKPGNVDIIVRDKKSVGKNMVRPSQQLSIPVVTIDSFDFQNVKLVQLDLEGYEPQALQGAIETLRKWKPDLILECVNNFEEVTKIIQPLGYVKVHRITQLDRYFKHISNLQN